MTESRRIPGLHLHSSIPVVEIEGEWDDTMGKSVSELISRLTHAGHLEIIVNLTRMTRSLQIDRTWIEALERIAESLRGQFGRLDVVGNMDQIQDYVRKQARSQLLWATTEEEAVGHIQGLPVYRTGPILTMRLTC